MDLCNPASGLARHWCSWICSKASNLFSFSPGVRPACSYSMFVCSSVRWLLNLSVHWNFPFALAPEQILSYSFRFAAMSSVAVSVKHFGAHHASYLCCGVDTEHFSPSVGAVSLQQSVDCHTRSSGSVNDIFIFFHMLAAVLSLQHIAALHASLSFAFIEII